MEAGTVEEGAAKERAVEEEAAEEGAAKGGVAKEEATEEGGRLSSFEFTRLVLNTPTGKHRTQVHGENVALVRRKAASNVSIKTIVTRGLIACRENTSVQIYKILVVSV